MQAIASFPALARQLLSQAPVHAWKYIISHDPGFFPFQSVFELLSFPALLLLPYLHLYLYPCPCLHFLSKGPSYLTHRTTHIQLVEQR